MKVCTNEAHHETASHHPVLGQQFQIIVVNVLRIVLDQLASEPAPIIEIGTAPSPSRGILLELLDGGRPQEKPHIIRVVNLSQSSSKIVALLHEEKRTEYHPRHHETGEEKHPSEIFAAHFLYDPKADDGKHAQGEHCA